MHINWKFEEKEFIETEYFTYQIISGLEKEKWKTIIV